ncbi:hypothetical protein IMZ48_35730 [Candidatus Bathyarchaeota archaeon]|nr:hypothetical protein [Candidatus Bathyarchaeota archaeon]
MDNSMDVTTLTTLELLESRLLQLEQMVYGTLPANLPSSDEVSITRQLEKLEQRFQALISRVRVYNDIHKICKLSFLRRARTRQPPFARPIPTQH